MNKFLKINFFSKKSATIIAGIVLFSLIVPQIAKANPLMTFLSMFVKDFTPAGIARAILAFTIQFVFYLLNWLVRAAAGFFNGMLNAGFESHLDIVKAGWQVTRDFSNMFFILFMVVIAFATILRTEKYGIKKLLPKVIIIALLINFSLVICSVIIDFSNIAANFFINDIRRYAGGDIAGRFTTSLHVLKLYTSLNCDDLSAQAPDYPPDFVGLRQPSPREQCIQQMVGGGNQAAQIGSDFLTFVISMTVGSIVLLIAAFVLFAGGILLLIRIVFIWFLVMLAPLVLLCYIMPALYKQWQKWWSSFLSWCFFAPVYAFFIWLAMKVSIEGRTEEVARLSSPEFISGGAFANVFMSAPATALIHYLFIIALLLGGLIAAKQLGIAGAAAAMSIVQKAGKGAKDWAKRTTTRPLVAAGTKVKTGAFAVGGALFGDTKLGRRMKARAAQIKRAPEERPEHKKYDAMLNTMSKEDLLREVETAGGVRRFIAARKAQSKGWLRDAKASQVQAATDTMKAFGATEVAKQIEETRPDSIRDRREQEATVQKVVQEGNLNKIPAIALKDESLVAAIAKLASAIQVESLRGVSPQHKEELEDKLEKITNPANAAAMTRLGINPALDKIQHAYASQTGDIRRMSAVQKTSWARNAGPDGLKRLSSFDSIIAENIPTSQLKNALEKMTNTAAVKNIVAYLKATPAAASHNLATTDEWLKNL